MRTTDEINAELKKVEKAKKDAYRKLERCNERIAELNEELLSQGTSAEDTN